MRGWGLILGFFLFVVVGNACAEVKKFSVRGQLATTYDDNVTFSHTNIKSDVSQSVLAGLDLKFEGSRNRFLAQADVLRNFYINNSSYDNTGVVFRASDLFELSNRMRLNFSDNYERSEEPRSFDDAFGRNSGRYRTDKNNLRAGFDFDVNSHTIFEWTYLNEFTGYSRNDLDNSFLNQTGGRVEYAFDEDNRMGLGYDFSFRDFSSGTSIAAHLIAVDFGHHFTKQLQLVVKVGEDFIDDEDSGNSQKARYEVSLLNDFDEATHAGLEYRQGLNSFAYSKDLFESYQISASLARELTRRVTVSGAGFYGHGEYQQSRIRDKLLGAGGGVDYAFSQQVSVGFNYSYSETISNQSVRSYRRNSVGVQTQMKF